MEYTLFAVHIGSFLLFGIFAAAAGYCFQRFVDQLHAEHHDQWEKAGKPLGGPGTLHEIGFWNLGNSLVFRWPLLWHWFRNTPSWAIGDLQAITWLSRFRRWFVASASMFVLAAVSFLAFFFVLDQ